MSECNLTTCKHVSDLEISLHKQEQAYLGWMKRCSEALKQRDDVIEVTKLLIEVLEVDGRWEQTRESAKKIISAIASANAGGEN
jgi:predicted MarR family transcription regulator